MRTKILVVGILFVGSLVSAQVPVAKTEAVGACATCSSNAGKVDEDLFSGVTNFQKIVDKGLSCENETAENCLLIQWIEEKYREYPACKAFFADDQKGKPGPLAVMVAKSIADDIAKNKFDSVFMKDNSDFDQPQICPGFKNMTPMQKVAFHTWIFELTAFPESGCNAGVTPNSASDVPNGPAVCLYQLELAQSLRKWRGPNCARLTPDEILKAEGCSACALDEYKRHMTRFGHPFAKLSADGTQKLDPAYWASHNPLTAATRAKRDIFVACKGKYKNDRKAQKANCVGSNEWEAPINFFKRLPRFPLCQTPEAKWELDQLKARGKVK